MPASRVAVQLNSEGVPSPDFGRRRTDAGIKHFVSGKWNQNTITNIGRNSLFAAIVTVGRRSMGDQLRLTPNGPRSLDEEDFGANNKPKVIQNPRDAHITTTARFDPIVSDVEHNELVEILDARGATQRGKPRSRDPDNNPLGTRVFDMACGWPMYRISRANSYKYVCGAYHQGNRTPCDHNTIDGPQAVRFVLACLRQKITEFRPQLESRLREIARTERDDHKLDGEIARVNQEIATLDADLKTVKRNLALAGNPDQFSAIGAHFDELTQRKHELMNESRKLEAAGSARDVESEVAAAMQVVDRLSKMVEDDADVPAIVELFRTMNVRLFLRFQKKQLNKREVNRLASGVLTTGSASPLIDLYAGPTKRVKKNSVMADPHRAGGGSPFDLNSGLEGNSSRNVNRGDWRCTFLNEPVGADLFWRGIAQTITFSAVEFFSLSV